MTDMSDLTVLCRTCFGYSQHDEFLAGQSVRCPKCDSIMDVPFPTAKATAVDSLKERAQQAPPPLFAKPTRSPKGVGTVAAIALSVGFGGFALIVLCCGGALW